MKQHLFPKILCLAINLFIFGSSLYIFINAPLNGYVFGTYVVPGGDFSYYRYFTNLSNMYGGIVSFVLAIYLAMHFEEDFSMSKGMRILQLTMVVSLMLTFLTVVFFLAPMKVASPNYFDMFSGDMFFFHFFNPVLSFIVFLFLTKGPKLTWKECFFGIIPMVVYAIFYTIFVLTGVWPDFYQFTFGGKYWLTVIVLPFMLGATYLISFLISLLYNKTRKQA